MAAVNTVAYNSHHLVQNNNFEKISLPITYITLINLYVARGHGIIHLNPLTAGVAYNHLGFYFLLAY